MAEDGGRWCGATRARVPRRGEATKMGEDGSAGECCRTKSVSRRGHLPNGGTFQLRAVRWWNMAEGGAARRMRACCAAGRKGRWGKMAHRASVASPATRVDVDTCHRGIFRVRAARGARRAVHGEACTRAARRGVVEDGGRWAGGAGKEHDAALRASLAEKVQELAAEAGPLTNTIQIIPKLIFKKGSTV